jgi:hypothetical protein
MKVITILCNGVNENFFLIQITEQHVRPGWLQRSVVNVILVLDANVTQLICCINPVCSAIGADSSRRGNASSSEGHHLFPP